MEDSKDTENAEEAVPEQESAAFGVVRGLTGLAVLVGAGLFALPWIISQTAIGDRIVARLQSRLPDGATI